MNIAIFADVHGRILLCLKLCARWQRETGEQIDLILQAGDLGAYPDRGRLDKATLRHAERDSSELGFLDDFAAYRQEVAAILDETRCPWCSCEATMKIMPGWTSWNARRRESCSPSTPTSASSA